MKLAKGPRPWSIWVFAIITLLGASTKVIVALSDMSAAQIELENDPFDIHWNFDKVVIAVSAMFTIELIPAAAIWLFASKFARLLVTLVAALAGILALNWIAWIVIGREPALGLLLPSIWTVLVASLLYFPSSRSWFAQKQEVDPATFD